MPARARLAVSTAVLAAGLLAVVLVHRAATRAELAGLLREQALVVRHTVGAAARVNAEAGRLAEEQLTARLLGTARLLAALDEARALDEDAVQSVARDDVFRVSVYGADGSLQVGAMATGHGGPGRGPGGGFGPGGGLGPGGGRGLGPGGGFGAGAGAGALVPRLLAGEAEVTTGIHRGRGRGGERIAAGVRRANGGAILVHADAGEVAGLLRQGSLEALFSEIARTTPEVAFLLFEQGELRVAHGDVPPTPLPEGRAEREIDVAGRPVLELAGPVELGPGAAGLLRIGLRLDRQRRAERRMAWLLAMVVVACLGLATLGVGAAWLARKYERLSARHALAEEALRRRDRLAAMGELAATVAHEVRNPLNAIGMSVQRLRREFAGPGAGSPADAEERDELLRILHGEVQRIDRIVQQFLQFARPRPIARAETDLAQLVREVVETSRAAAATRSVTLDADVDGVIPASLDAPQVRQALDNLVRNAIEATPAGGRVQVRARSEPDGHTLVVEDTGQGIAAEDVPRIFGLYFTTKPGGTGVGLAVTQQIVAAHDGTIEVESKPGEGTRMTVRLPAAPAGAGDA